MKNSTKSEIEICAFHLKKYFRATVTGWVLILFTGLKVNVFAAPVPAINGYFFYLCQGATAPFFDDAPGGTWSISPATAGVASVSASGVVTGLSAGTATLSYTVGGGSATAVVTVYPTPAPISGFSSICLSASMTLSDAVPGAVWSSGIPATATIGSTGVVTANNPGVVPMFYTFTVSGCGVTKMITVNTTPAAIGGPVAVCTGTSAQLIETTGGGSWSSSNPAKGTISASGVITGITAGTTVITYAYGTTCATSATITVDQTAVAGTITGITGVCEGATVALTDTAIGGVWSVDAVGIATVNATGGVTGVAAGTTTISYAVTNSCGTVVTSQALTVDPLPIAGTITGNSFVCAGSSTLLADTAAGGIWSASGDATIDGAGNVTGMAGGSATISYTVTNSCGVAVATFAVTVNTLPDPGTITGTGGVCAGASIHLTNTVPGGVWSATPNAATDGSGNVTGITAGAATVSYSVTNSCGTASTTSPLTIAPLPVAGTIAGATVVCVGTITHVSDTAGGGIWSITANASVDGSGNISGITAGTATLSYTVTNSCGVVAAVRTVTVNAVAVSAISGLSTVNAGSTIALSDTVIGGVWAASNGNATVGSSGVVTGVTAGSVTISYSIVSSCSNAVATKLIGVNAVTVTPTSISGYYFYLCAGTTTPFFDAVAGGAWSISPLSVASVSATGVVSGISAGTAILSYTTGTSSATAVVTVYPTPVAIGGNAAVCQGATTLLSDITPGGVWSSSIPATATIGTSGVVSATNTGTVTMYYTLAAPAGCRASVVVTVNANPAGITGPIRVCTGASITLSDITPGGAWSCATAYAVVDSAGNVSGVSAGTANVTYVLATGCFKSAAIAVNQSPAPISGTLSVCAGNRVFLSDAVSGISWASGNTSVATISGSGALTGIGAGTSTITYTLANTCITTAVVTVNAVPVVSAILGASSVSYGGAGIVLSDLTSSGIWSSSNSAILAVGSGSGTVTAVAHSGSASISYTVTNSFGCSAFVTKAISISAVPGHGRSAATTTVGATIGIADDAMGGEWLSDDNSVATVDENGMVSAIAEGSATISHTITNSYGEISTNATTLSVTPLPLEVSVFPNPNNGAFTIKGTGGTTKEAVTAYEITNMLGQVVCRNKITATSGIINESVMLGSNLSSGMYLLNVSNGNEHKTVHFAIEK